MRRLFPIAASLAGALLAAAPRALAAEVDLAVSANRNQIYLGESVLLSVKVSGTSRSNPPDLSAIANATVRPLGSQDRSQYSVTMINGRVTRTGFSGREFTYEITPSAAGRFRAGPIALEHDGRRLAAPGPDIEVMGIETQDRVVIRVTASKSTVLVDEPFAVTLSIALKRLKGRFAETDPLLPGNPPKLTVPYLAVQPIPGLEGPDVAKLLQSLLTRHPDQPGFRLNDFTVRADPFDNFFRFDGMFRFGEMLNEREARFAFDRRPIQRDGEPFYEYSLTLTYIPRDEKSHTFGPVVFKGDAVLGVDAAGQAATRPIFAVGPACVVRVVAPPEEGRPATFIGAVGSNLVAEAALDAQTCKVGDPLTLTLSVSGSVNMNNVRPPVLNDQEALTRDFRVDDDSVQTASKPGQKTFTYTLRPLRVGTYEFPSVDLAYYDTRDRAYRVAHTRPLPLRVNKAAEVNATDVIAAPTNRVTVALTGGARSDLPLAPLDVTPLGAIHQPLKPEPWQLAVASTGPAAFVLLLLAKAARRVAARAAATRGRRHALAHAHATLRRARNLPADQPAAANRLALHAFRQFLADRFDVPAAAIAPSDAERLLARRNVPADLAAEFVSAFQRRFDAAFSPVSAPSLEPASSLPLLFSRLDQALDAPPSLPPATCLLPPILLLLSLGATPAHAETDSARRFVWDQAGAHMAAAHRPEEFLVAAGDYRKLADMGVRNGPLFYDLGCALLKANQPLDACRAFLRAERYLGANPDLRRNLSLAIAAAEQDGAFTLPWYRPLFLWHYSLPYPVRVTVAAFAFAAVWLALALRLLGARDPASRLLALSLVALALFGSSVATTVHQELRADAPAALTATQAPSPPPAPRTVHLP